MVRQLVRDPRDPQIALTRKTMLWLLAAACARRKSTPLRRQQHPPRHPRTPPRQPPTRPCPRRHRPPSSSPSSCRSSARRRAEHLLGALDRALAAAEEEPPFESEVLLSPVDASAQRAHALPNHSRFELRLLHDEPRPRRAFVTSGEHSCGAPPRFEAVFDALGGAAAAAAPAAPLAAAINRAVRLARGSLLLLLTDAAAPQPGFLAPLRAALAAPGVGVAGARLLDEHGRLHHAGYDVALGELPPDARARAQPASARRRRALVVRL